MAINDNNVKWVVKKVGGIGSDKKVTNILSTKTKAYITGTTEDITNTGEQVFDTGVYLDNIEGGLAARTITTDNITVSTNLNIPGGKIWIE